MDLSEAALQEQTALEHVTSSKTLPLAQVLDSQASSGGSLAHFTVSHTSQGLTVLQHSALDGTSTVTSLPGFSFDTVDVAVKSTDAHVQEHELSVAHCSMGVEGRFVIVIKRKCITIKILFLAVIYMGPKSFYFLFSYCFLLIPYKSVLPGYINLNQFKMHIICYKLKFTVKFCLHGME